MNDTAEFWTVRRIWIFLAIVTFVGLFLDLATKQWAESALTGGRRIRVLGDVISFILVYNKGGIFGIDPRRWLPGAPVNVLFIVFNSIATLIIVAYYRFMARRDAFVRFGLALVLPGALGNLFDRIVRPGKGVVDFIMVDLNIWPADPWPIFNVADMFVTFGVIAILASLVRDEIVRARATRGVVTEAAPQNSDGTHQD